MHGVDRRVFLKGSGAALAAAMSGPNLLAAAKAAEAGSEDAASIVAGKDSRLMVHTAEPPVLETPPQLLAGQQTTPTSLFFVRNCQSPPKVEGDDPLASWQVEVDGLVNRPQSFDGKLLRSLPRAETEMVVQCSGNGRKLFSEAAQTEGTQWLRGGMACVKFAGVRLADVLDKLGVEAKPGAKFLTAEGKDEAQPGKNDFEHSLPLDECLANSLLVWELAGEPLPVIHGGPLRLVTPGIYGTMHVKWLTRMKFTAEETDHWSQLTSYRTPLARMKPGTKFTLSHDNSEYHWRMRLKSVVLTPTPGAKLSGGKVRVEGVAFNDGKARIDSVLVSTDRGHSWQRAKLQVPDSPYAWYPWQADLDLPRGEQQIWARAVDSLGRTQPLEGSIFWNPKGYTWNGVEKIKVTVS